MAVAEARAAWQRTANRCLVQEDAKRAPKLACCPSASPSVQQVDAGSVNGADGQDATSLGLLPYKQNSSYSNLSPSSRWWLQHQPNYCYQSTFANEQLNLAEAEMESVDSSVSSFTKVSGGRLQEESESLSVDEPSNAESLESSIAISATPINKDLEAGKQGLEDTYDKKLQNPRKVEDIGDYYVITNKAAVGCEASKKLDEVSFDSGCNWFGDEKSEPWWRTADKDELAHFVAQRSLALVENCDLPRPLKPQVKRDPYLDLCDFDNEELYATSGDVRPGIGEFHKFYTQSPRKVTSESSFNRRWPSVDAHFQPGQDQPPIRTDKSMPETHAPDSDPSKAQLLEALRHSQTRAREAENAAKQAYEEKEHVVKLVFRQASQLFAYKQWFHLLQLENLYVQVKNNKSQPKTAAFPVILPGAPLRSRKVRKNWHQKAARGRRSKRGCPKYDITKYAVVFAVGLSLVGAGLLLGWTVGWMLPTF